MRDGKSSLCTKTNRKMIGAIETPAIVFYSSATLGSATLAMKRSESLNQVANSTLIDPKYSIKIFEKIDLKTRDSKLDTWNVVTTEG